MKVLSRKMDQTVNKTNHLLYPGWTQCEELSWIFFDTARRVESWILLSGNVVRTLG